MIELGRTLAPADAAIPVPACPAWTVKDVYAHLQGACADVLAGRMEGAASDPWTARQVAERADRALPEILDEWEASGDAFDALVAALGDAMDPRLLMDQWTHEQDIRNAVGRPSERDGDVAQWGASRMLRLFGSIWRKEALPAIAFEMPDGTHQFGEGEVVATLRTTPYEVMRFALGRRTYDQMAALDWDGDPTPFLPHLHVFGPAEKAVLE